MKIVHVLFGAPDSSSARRAVTDLAAEQRSRGVQTAVVDGWRLLPGARPRHAGAPEDAPPIWFDTDSLAPLGPDLIHVHADRPVFPASAREDVPTITTVRCRVDPSQIETPPSTLPPLCVAVRVDDIVPTASLQWIGVVRDGVDERRYPFAASPGAVLAVAGTHPRLDRALALAMQSGLPVKAAIEGPEPASLARWYCSYGERGRIERVLIRGRREWIAFLENALALIVAGPAGAAHDVAVIEALACGTPTLAFSDAGVEDLVRCGVTGFVVDSVAEAAEAVDDLLDLDRSACRDEFQRHYAVDQTAGRYAELYSLVLQELAPRRIA